MAVARQEFRASAPFRGCFAAGTMVLMADGKVRPIERVRVGATLWSGLGPANRVVGVERLLLGDRRLYALNGGGYFVTAEHPFMTPVGWKAIDRAAAAALGEFKIGRLVPGDAVAMRCGIDPSAPFGRPAPAAAGDTDLVFEPVVRLRSRPAEAGTRLYRLRLEGEQGYFANGYLVRIKGPDAGGKVVVNVAGPAGRPGRIGRPRSGPSRSGI